MKKQKRQFTAEFKVEVFRKHLENQIPVGKLCGRYDIHPNLIYLWKKELFSGAVETFGSKKNRKGEQNKIDRLEDKIKDKDSLISEIVEDNLRLKKS